MVAYCLENKSTALSLIELRAEILSLAGQEAYYHPEILFRRLPLQGFSLPREALWSLIYFHHGRNKTSGLYYSRRTLQTASGNPFRIGESIRLLERRGYLQRQSAVGWRVLQENTVTGVKHPAFRASAVGPFLQNPTKERWIALRFILCLALLGNRKPSYRAIQLELGCGSDLARHLVQLAKEHLGGVLAPERLRNRLFNWTKEKPTYSTNQQVGEEAILEKKSTVRWDQRPVLPPIPDAPKAVIPNAENAPLPAENRTESGPQYKALNKEEEKKNPSTRPQAGSNPGEGRSRNLKKIRLNALGFSTSENLLVKSESPAEAMDAYRQDLGGEDHFEAAQALYREARSRAQFREEDPDRLARHVVDVWLEMLRRKGTFKSSPLGYFFTSLRNNLAAGYCRLDLKRKAMERQRTKDQAETRYQTISRLEALYGDVRRKVVALCEMIEPTFHALRLADINRKIAIVNTAFEQLRSGGEFNPLEISLFEFCEDTGCYRENLGRYLDAHETLILENAPARPRLKEAA